MMKYKGYIGHVEYDDEAKIFHGEVVGLSDIITFQGKSVDELEEAFKGSVDDYLLGVKKEAKSQKKHFLVLSISEFLPNYMPNLPSMQRQSA